MTIAMTQRSYGMHFNMSLIRAKRRFPPHQSKKSLENQFYCVNTSYPMDNMLNRSAQTGPPNVRKRRPVFPPAGRSVVLCTPQMAPRTSFLSRQPDVIASFSFGACTVQTCFQQSPDILKKSVHYDGFTT